MGLKEKLENLLVESREAVREAEKRIKVEQARDAVDRETRRKQGFLFIKGLSAVDKMRTVDEYARKIFGPPPRGFSNDQEFRERIERKPSGEIIGHGILIMRIVAGIDKIDIGDYRYHYVDVPRLSIKVAYQFNGRNEAGFYVGTQDPRDNEYGPFMNWSKPSLWTPERFEEVLMDVVQGKVKR